MTQVMTVYNQNTEDRLNDYKSEFNNILDNNSDSSSQIANKIKLLDLDSAKSLIVETAMLFDKMSDKKSESGFLSRLSQKVPILKNVISKSEETFSETIIEGKSIHDITQKLLGGLEDKRTEVETVCRELFSLRQHMIDSYNGLNALVTKLTNDINQEENTDNEHNISDLDTFLMKGLLSEVLSLRTVLMDNIQTSEGVIAGAQSSLTQIGSAIPKLKLQLTDSMSVAAVAGQLQELTDMMDSINNACEILRDDNREKVEKQLLHVIESSAPTDAQLKKIESNETNQKTLMNKVSMKMKESIVQRDKSIEVLQRVAGTDVQVNSSSLLSSEMDIKKLDK